MHTSQNASRSELQTLFEYKLQAILLGGQFFTAMVIGLLMPNDFNSSIQLDACIELFRRFAPNIYTFSHQGFSPLFLEAYIIFLSILWVPFFTVYVAIRPKSKFLPPIKNFAGKVISLIFLVMFMLVASSLWWNPIVGEMQLGLLDGRFGAFLKLGLGSKIGASTILNLFFCTGPLLFFIASWSISSRPTN